MYGASHSSQNPDFLHQSYGDGPDRMIHPNGSRDGPPFLKQQKDVRNCLSADAKKPVHQDANVPRLDLAARSCAFVLDNVIESDNGHSSAALRSSLPAPPGTPAGSSWRSCRLLLAPLPASSGAFVDSPMLPYRPPWLYS